MRCSCTWPTWLELGDEHGRDPSAHLTDKDPATGEYIIPRIIYSDAYYSETVPYADLVLPDTTYLERWDCISLLIGRSPRPMARPMRSASRSPRPTATCGLSSTCCSICGRLKLPGMTKGDGTRAIPAAMLTICQSRA